MPDLSKIKLDGTIYNLKDSIARTLVIPITTNENGEMQPVGTTLIEAIEAFNAGRRIVLRNNNYDLYIDHTDNTSLEGTSNNPNGNGYIHITWDSNGLTGDSVGMPPKTTSDLINDSDFATTSEVNSLITSAIGNINSFEVSVVASLPTSDIDTHTIYFVSNSSSGDSIYDEYMYINNNWEKIGSTAVDLSNYLQKTDISDWAKASTKPTYTASEVGAAASDHTHTEIGIIGRDNRGKVITTSSSVEIDAYMGQGGDSNITLNPGRIELLASAKTSTNNTTSIIFSTWPYTSGSEIQHIKLSDGATTINGVVTPTTNDMAANKKYVDDSIATITHPTNISAFNNDVGYLTSFTETDPTVPAWAKESTKPSYTASEVGAIADTEPAASITQTNIDNWTKKSNLFTISSGSTDNDYWWKLKIDRSNLFAFTNAPGSNGYLKYIELPVNRGNNYISLQLPTTSGKLALVSDIYNAVPDWARASTKPTYTASEVGALPSNTTYVSTFNGQSGAIIYTAPITSVNGQTGAVVVDKIKLTSMENNEEFYFVNTGAINTTSTQQLQVNPLLTFTKTKNYGRLTLGSTSTPGRIRLYSSANSASGFTDLVSEVSSTNERIITFPDETGTVALTSNIPSVPSWALQSSKPTYTAAEVGAVPLTSNGNITITNTGKSTSTIQFINDDDNPGLIKILAEEVRINGIPTPTVNNQAVNKKYVDDAIAAITHPTNVSTFTNDAGYLTLADLPIYDGTVV